MINIEDLCLMSNNSRGRRAINISLNSSEKIKSFFNRMNKKNPNWLNISNRRNFQDVYCPYCQSVKEGDYVEWMLYIISIIALYSCFEDQKIDQLLEQKKNKDTPIGLIALIAEFLIDLKDSQDNLDVKKLFVKKISGITFSDFPQDNNNLENFIKEISLNPEVIIEKAKDVSQFREFCRLIENELYKKSENDPWLKSILEQKNKLTAIYLEQKITEEQINILKKDNKESGIYWDKKTNSWRSKIIADYLKEKL